MPRVTKTKIWTEIDKDGNEITVKQSWGAWVPDENPPTTVVSEDIEPTPTCGPVCKTVKAGAKIAVGVALVALILGAASSGKAK